VPNRSDQKEQKARRHVRRHRQTRMISIVLNDVFIVYTLH